MNSNINMVSSLPPPLLLLFLLLPCSSSSFHVATITKNKNGVHDIPITAFLASNRQSQRCWRRWAGSGGAVTSLPSCEMAPTPTTTLYSSRSMSTTSTTLYTSRSSSSSSNNRSEYNDDERNIIDDRFHHGNVAGVSVSPQGFLVLVQSDFDTSNSINDSDGNDANDRDKDASSNLIFPILLTSAPLEDAPSTAAATNYTNNKLPELFQLNKNMDQTSVSTPEALTYLQLLNGVDMATPVLPPDILSLVCVWYAFLLLEEEERSSVDADAGESGLDDGSLVIVEDELGLNDSNNDDNNAMTMKSTNTCRNEFQDALDYIRAMVRTTLPLKNNIIGGGGGSSSNSNTATSYLEASPGQRSKVQLPRVWLRGIQIQEVAMMGKKDDLVTDSITTTTTTIGDALHTTIGRVPIQFTLQCSVDDGSKMLDIPLFAIPTIQLGREQSTTQHSLQYQVGTRLVEISNELLQELSHNYHIETSASFLSLALLQRYSIKSSGARGTEVNTGSSVPTLNVSTSLLEKLAGMQQSQYASSPGERTRYCWVLPTLDNETEKKSDVNNDIDKVIQNQGLPYYRSLSEILKEGQRGTLNQGNRGSDNIGGDATNKGSENESPRRKIKQLTLEQQATQHKLMSAWKIANQRNDAGALERIQKAMEDLEEEVSYDDDGDDDDVDDSALKIIQRAMQLKKPSDSDILAQDEEVVGLISDLEEATMNSSVGENNTESGNDER
jgi:hypothetical protein